MIFLILFSTILFFVISFWLWIVIHELSHAAMANCILDVTQWKIRIWPAKMLQSVVGEFEFSHRGVQTPWETAGIGMAPLIPDLLAVCMLPLLHFLPFPWQCIWLAFWINGLFDGIFWAVGTGRWSDINRVANALNISSVILLVPVVMLTIISMVVTIWMF